MKNMKNIFAFMLGILALALIIDNSYGQCSSISRTNFSPNTVLTSTELNSQFNTAYNFLNAYDGGCISTGTLPIEATDSSFGPLKDYLQAGCKVTYSNASTLSISRCYAAVNGAFVSKSTSTSVSFGCTNCSSETVSTRYYLYIADGSTGTTLTPLITTTAPNEDGYDASNNRVLARFYNNATSDIDQYSIDQWHVNRFLISDKSWESYTPTAVGLGTISSAAGKWRRVGDTMEIEVSLRSGSPTAVDASLSIPSGYNIDLTKISSSSKNVAGTFFVLDGTNNFGSTNYIGVTWVADSDTSVYFSRTAASDTALDKTDGNSLLNPSDGFIARFSVPIAGWEAQ